MKLNQDIPPYWKPIGELAAPVGYAASARIQSNLPDSDSVTNFNDLCQLAEEIMSDPLKMRLLGDRVYQLMLEDVRLQKERIRKY
jgi:hypothetical protein